MKKLFWLTGLCLLFLFLSADNALVQEENQKEPPVQEIVNAEIEQVDPQIQALTDQLRYYRTIGDIEKAHEIWQQLTPLINYEPEKYETGEEKFEDGMVIDSVEAGEREGPESETWWSTDYYVMWTTNHDKATSMEVVTGHGTNNPNMYIAAEKWAAFTNPDDISLKRSDNHGTSWPSTSAYQQEISSSTYQLALPKMKQIHPDYLGIVFQRRYSATDYDIHFVKQSWDFSTSNYYYPDNSSGTIHHRPDIASDYEDYGSAAYLYLVYFEGNPPTKLLFRMSSDEGATWSAAQTLATFTTSTQSQSAHCSIDYENDDVFVAFTMRAYTGALWQESIAVVKSDNYGSTWSSPVIVSSLSAAAYYPSITAVGATVVTAYERPYSSTDRDIYYSYSLNSGSSWTTTLALGTSTLNEYKPIVRSGVSTYIYCAYNLAPTGIYLRRTTTPTPTSWTSLGNVKNSMDNIAQEDIPGLVPKLTSTGATSGVAVSWAEYYDGSYGYDVCFDASWQSCLPGTFSNVAPLDNATNIAVTAIIDWNASSGATSYDVYFGTASSPPFVGTTTLTYWDPPGSMAYGTHYYWRAIAKNSCGSTYGSIWDFTTQSAVVPPTVTTNTTVTSITALGAVCGGNVTSDGGATVTARGVCWDTLSSPTIADPHTSNGTGTGVFSSTLTGLTPNTHYYVRAYATNSAGTGYGLQREFTTLTWIQIPGSLASLVAGDFNNNGTDDLAGLNASGAVYYTTNLSTWTSIPGTLTFSSLVVGDFNNNGTADLAGLTIGGSVYYTTNLSTWTNIPGTLASLAVGDFNNDGSDDLAGLNAIGAIYYTTNRVSWNLVPGKLASLVAGDFISTGPDDLAGLNATGYVYYSTNLSTWTRVLGTIAKLTVGDFNNNGIDDLAGLNASGYVYFTTNLSTWTRIPGTLASLAVGDFISPGSDDLAGLNAIGHVYFTTNLSTWTRIPGTIAKLVVGDFNNDGRDDLAGLNAGGAIYYIKL